MNSTWRRAGSMVVGALAVVVAASVAEASHRESHPRKHRIVYHLNEAGADKAKAVLGNIRNHVKGVRGWDHIEAPSW